MNNYFKNSESGEKSCYLGRFQASNSRLRLDLGHHHLKLSWQRCQYSPLPSEVQLGERASLCSRGSKLQHHCNRVDGMLAALLAGKAVIDSPGLNGTASLNEACQAHPLSSAVSVGGRGALERSKDYVRAKEPKRKRTNKTHPTPPTRTVGTLATTLEALSSQLTDDRHVTVKCQSNDRHSPAIK